MAKKIATTIYITEEQQALLKELNCRSKVPIAEFIRQGIDMVLDHYQELLPGQMRLGALPMGPKPLSKEAAESRSFSSVGVNNESYNER